MATGSGLGPQTGAFMGPLLMNLDKSHFGLANLPINKKNALLYSLQELEYLARVVLGLEEQAVSVTDNRVMLQTDLCALLKKKKWKSENTIPEYTMSISGL